MPSARAIRSRELPPIPIAKDSKRRMGPAEPVAIQGEGWAGPWLDYPLPVQPAPRFTWNLK